MSLLVMAAERSAPGFWKRSRLSEPGLSFTLGRLHRGGLGFESTQPVNEKKTKKSRSINES